MYSATGNTSTNTNTSDSTNTKSICASKGTLKVDLQIIWPLVYLTLWCIFFNISRRILSKEFGNRFATGAVRIITRTKGAYISIRPIKVLDLPARRNLTDK